MNIARARTARPGGSWRSRSRARGVGGLVRGHRARLEGVVAGDDTIAPLSPAGRRDPRQGLHRRHHRRTRGACAERPARRLHRPPPRPHAPGGAGGRADRRHQGRRPARGLEPRRTEPQLVLPLLNGLDHIAVLRERFRDAASWRARSASRPTAQSRASSSTPASSCASTWPPSTPMPARRWSAWRKCSTGGGCLRSVGDSEPQVMWSKLVRLNALACTTSAYDLLLGEIRSTPELRADLVGAIEEGCAVAQAEGASISTGDPLGELTAAHATLGSSMQRDIAAGRPPELDAIPGAVLAQRRATRSPVRRSERLVAVIAQRTNAPLPAAARPSLGRAQNSRGERPRRSRGRHRVGGDGVHDLLLLHLLRALIVLGVAQHPEVPTHSPIDLHADARAGSARPPPTPAAQGRSARARSHKRCGWGSRGRAPPRPGRSARGSWRSCRCRSCSEKA